MRANLLLLTTTMGGFIFTFFLQVCRIWVVCTLEVMFGPKYYELFLALYLKKDGFIFTMRAIWL